MRQFLTYGSVRGVARKGHPYRDSILKMDLSHFAPPGGLLPDIAAAELPDSLAPRPFETPRAFRGRSCGHNAQIASYEWQP